jgi:alpha-1,6-mannosyltransferase
MSEARQRASLALCLFFQASVFAAAAIAARHGQPPSLVVFCIAAAFVPYGALIFFTRALAAVRAPGLVVTALASTLGAIWLLAPPILSDDVYRYVWEGGLWLEGLNPYAVAPAEPSLAAFRDDLWTPINNKELASIYPPLSQLLFVAAAWLGGGVTTVKLLALLGLAVSAGWIARVTGDLRLGLALGLNPLLSAESALNGHFDVLVGVAFFAVAWELSRGRFARAGVAVCAAVGLKVVGLVTLPLLWRRPKVLALTAFGAALLLAPLAMSRAITDESSGTGEFARRWQGNESLFALADRLGHWLAPEEVAGLVARALVAAVLLAVLLLLLLRRTPPAKATRIIVWSVLLLSPQVHPWYLGWLLPLDLAAGGRAGLIWSAVVLCAYAPLDGWIEHGIWEMPVWLQITEYALVGAMLTFDLRRNSKYFS